MAEFCGSTYIAVAGDRRRTPLLLLHGSSGSETDLLPLAARIAPDAPAVSLRGSLAWEDGYAFFRRNSDRTLDFDDLAERTRSLCRTIAAMIKGDMISGRPLLVGYSNGAIIAASMLFHRPACAAGAILMRPLSPSSETTAAAMPGKPILILCGENDTRRAPQDAAIVARQFEAAGARVALQVFPAGHAMHNAEPLAIRDWIDREFGNRSAIGD